MGIRIERRRFGAESRSRTDRLVSANSDSKTSTVRGKLPNGWGLYDMLGNVSERVNDWYDRDYYVASPAADPQGSETGSYRVQRL